MCLAESSLMKKFVKCERKLRLLKLLKFVQFVKIKAHNGWSKCDQKIFVDFMSHQSKISVSQVSILIDSKLKVYGCPMFGQIYSTEWFCSFSAGKFYRIVQLK